MNSVWIAKIRYLTRLGISLPILPYIYWLGKRVESRMPTLPEADQNLIGNIAISAASIKPFNILCIGESSMAGVGVKDHRDGLAGVIADNIHRYSQRSVRWTVVAQRGLTAKEVKEYLVPKIPTQMYDLIVIGLGGNDTFQMSSPLKWHRAIKELLGSLRQKHRESKIVIANMPPVRWFPAFPPLLRWLMTGQIKLLKQAIKDLPQRFENVFFLQEQIRLIGQYNESGKQYRHRDLFSDGVHPTKLAYRLWGEQIAEFICEKALSKFPDLREPKNKEDKAS